jgi:hypothetical protein
VYRIALSLVALACLFALPAAPASAGAEWCEDDPLVVMTTPRGKTVEVWVTTYAQGAQYAPNLDAATITHAAKPARVGDGRGTRFDLFVVVPEYAGDGRFRTRAVVSSGPNATGTIYDSDEGWSGKTLRLRVEFAVE